MIDCFLNIMLTFFITLISNDKEIDSPTSRQSYLSFFFGVKGLIVRGAGLSRSEGLAKGIRPKKYDSIKRTSASYEVASRQRKQQTSTTTFPVCHDATTTAISSLPLPHDQCDCFPSSFVEIFVSSLVNGTSSVRRNT